MLLYTSLLPYLFLIVIPIFIAFVLKSSIKTKTQLPPGPWGLPIIGNLLNLGNKPHLSLTNLATIHGPIMTLKLGQSTTIVISSSTIAREALQKQQDAFSDKHVPDAIRTQDHFKNSVVWLPISDHWRSLRKKTVLLLSANNKIGHSNQPSRPEMLNQLMAYVNKCSLKNEVVDIRRATYSVSLNLLFSTIFSVDLADLSQDLSTEFAHLVQNILMEVGALNLADFYPLLRKFDLQGIKHRMTAPYVKLLKIFRTLIDERLELRRSTKVNREDDGLDILLNSSKGAEIDITDHLERLFVDLFIAGTHTTSISIEWAMAELLKNPAILKQARVELEQTIGKGKLVEDSDISRLPYLGAIVKETMRKNPSIPLLDRTLIRSDVEICGYKVPKGAQVLINVWAIGRDPNIWENPVLFNPERFLNSNINDRTLDSEFIPFSVGKRICPGMAMVMKHIPMVVGSLINLFDWEIEGGIAPEELDMEDKFVSPTFQKAQPLRLVPIRF